MSYILEALRRSQAERERGQVPGLNAQPAAVAALPALREGPPWHWLLPAGLGGLAVAALLLWFWRAPAAPSAAAVLAAPTPTHAPTQALTPAPTPGPAPSPAPSPAPLPVVVSAPPQAASPPPAAVAAATPPAPAPAVSPGSTTAALPTSPSATATAPTSTSVSTPRTVRFSDLSAEQRRELPALSMGGSVWSESALSRFVIVNGQVVREGDTAAPGVVVDRIGPKSVLLRWRELRLEVPI